MLKAQQLERMIVLGASGHATVVLDAIQLQNRFEVIALIDELNTERHGTIWRGIPIVGGLEQLPTILQSGVRKAIVAIGDCVVRTRLAEQLVSAGYELATVVHPRAVVATDTCLGDGTVVMAGAVINAGSRIGRNVIINSNATIEHECVIDDGTHISPACCLAGNVQVGRQCWIGMGSIVKERTKIGNNVQIGAGSLVLKDVPSDVLTYGVPARIVTRKS